MQGAAGSETSYGDPLDAALAWQAAGAQWLHLVDLDAAFGRGSNAELLAQVTGKLDIKVEMSGGIRDDASLERALSTGCARVNIGTAAMENPGWVRDVIARHGDRIAIGLDVRGRTLAARGWTREGGDLYEALDRLDAAGCARYVITDVLKDGMLQAAPTWTCTATCAPARRPRSSPAAGCPAWTTCAPWPALPVSASRAPSSARPCTPARSPWKRPSRRWQRAGCRKAGRRRDRRRPRHPLP